MTLSILLTQLKELLMSNGIESLKKDKSDTLKYRTRLLKKGKTDLASKMRRKADKIQDMINYLRTAS
jgi:ketol-acid reductoisomerase